LRNELKETSVAVACLTPGPTETEFAAEQYRKMAEPDSAR
jgi:short-subunit dehydrogenase